MVESLIALFSFSSLVPSSPFLAFSSWFFRLLFSEFRLCLLAPPLVAGALSRISFCRHGACVVCFEVVRRLSRSVNPTSPGMRM